MFNEIEIIPVMEHVEVYRGNKFLFSADSAHEARKELLDNITVKPLYNRPITAM